LARIQAADSTRVADENFLGFALGEKLRSRSSIAPHTAKKEQKKIVRASQPGFGSPQQQQQLSRTHLNRAAA
jgi:hypothetical protein